MDSNATQLSGLVILCLVAILGTFYLLHVRPLKSEEVEGLANKRRSKRIKAYYRFLQAEVAVNADFKSAMLARGGFYSFRTPLYEFPALAAALLKYKKHEWIVIGFERNQEIDYGWLNKGRDNSQVRARMSHVQVINHARSGKHTTVVVLHNHPNSDPGNYNLLGASEQDRLSAMELERALLPSAVNLLEFVCERGRFLEYYRGIAPGFMAIEGIIAEVTAQNGITHTGNFRLHIERLF